ncbi:nuclear transport factor 2 family protein [Sphingomonas sp. KC8]|uniref:nuclear transport factor 2 family protein n=1 Tax=Sphingomonas sp. KC8 TaxID=1030157 RepID=UPI0002D615CE|nr:nuclear transport factor 2 family protein [Sphingomonas sp. KC8]ARS25821.1 hypothetical protein KC8_00735 [Sphingomonas sp. KC8]
MAYTAKRTARLIAAIPAALALLALAPTAGQAKTPSSGNQHRIQTLLDERDIERLIVDYSWVLDAKDFDTYGALFSHGIVLDPQGKTIAKGAAEVGALARHYLGGNPDVFVRHIVSNVRIDVAADGKTATAGSFLTTIEAPQGQPASIFRIARYHDNFAKIDGGWKFLSRQEMTDWVLRERQHPAPPSAK